MAAKGEANSQLWVVPPENRVSGQYIVLEASPLSKKIVLEASPGPSDLNPWIHGLLGPSRTFMVTPTKSHKYPKSWLGQIDLIWQEFESITSPNFSESRNCFCTLQKSGYIWCIRTPFWNTIDSKSYGLKFPTTCMLITFLFDIIFKPFQVNL
jgi:hypothetical protein